MTDTTSISNKDKNSIMTKEEYTEKEKERLGVAFQELNGSIIKEDRARACLKFAKSDRQIARYLAGNVMNPAFGKLLYDFLRSCVIAREKNLNQFTA